MKTTACRWRRFVIVAHVQGHLDIMLWTEASIKYRNKSIAKSQVIPIPFAGLVSTLHKAPDKATISEETGKRGSDARAETPLRGSWGEERRKTDIDYSRPRPRRGRTCDPSRSRALRLAPGDAKQQGVPRVLSLSGQCCEWRLNLCGDSEARWCRRHGQLLQLGAGPQGQGQHFAAVRRVSRLNSASEAWSVKVTIMALWKHSCGDASIVASVCWEISAAVIEINQ